MDACDELILVKASWIQRFLPLSISPDADAQTSSCSFSAFFSWTTVLSSSRWFYFGGAEDSEILPLKTSRVSLQTRPCAGSRCSLSMFAEVLDAYGGWGAHDVGVSLRQETPNVDSFAAYICRHRQVCCFQWVEKRHPVQLLSRLAS